MKIYLLCFFKNQNIILARNNKKLPTVLSFVHATVPPAGEDPFFEIFCVQFFNDDFIQEPASTRTSTVMADNQLS